MAPNSKFLYFLFFTTLSFSLQIHARDSQFFSKVTHFNDDIKDREVPNPNYEKPLNKPEQEQESVFIPETENSYGLYGHESGLHPPTTTNNAYDPNSYRSYEKTSSQNEINNKNNYYGYQKDSYSNKYPNEISDTRLIGTSYNNNYKDSSNEFSSKKFPEEGYNPMENQNKNYNENDFYNEFSNKIFSEEGYNSMENQNNNDNKKYYYNNNVAANNNNGERQGMSDTRVMEGGKYYYDVNSEKYNPTFNGDSSKGMANSGNWYDKKGYFGNNNVNSHENSKNSMEGSYQNQEEFEDDQEEFEP